MTELLFSTHGSKGKITEKGKRSEKLFIKLKGVSDRITWFTDIPDRSAGNQHFDEFIRLWDEKYFADGADPNAALEYENEYGNSDVVVFEMKKPKYNKKKDILKFEARIDKDQVLEGPFQRHLIHADNDFKERLKRPSLFIDNAQTGWTYPTTVLIANNLNTPILINPIDYKQDGVPVKEYIDLLFQNSGSNLENIWLGFTAPGRFVIKSTIHQASSFYKVGEQFIKSLKNITGDDDPDKYIFAADLYENKQMKLLEQMTNDMSQAGTAQDELTQNVGQIAKIIPIAVIADAISTKYKTVINDQQDPWLLMPGEIIKLEGRDTRWGVSNGVADIGFQVTTQPLIDEVTGLATTSVLGSAFFDNPFIGRSWAKLSPAEEGSNGLPIQRNINEIESITMDAGSHYETKNFDGGSFSTIYSSGEGWLDRSHDWILEINPTRKSECSGTCYSFSYES